MGTVGGEELARWENAEGFEAAAGVEGGGGGKTEKILVSVRLRPLSEKEVAKGEPADWECINDTTIIFRSSLPERPLLPSAYSFGKYSAP